MYQEVPDIWDPFETLLGFVAGMKERLENTMILDSMVGVRVSALDHSLNNSSRGPIIHYSFSIPVIPEAHRTVVGSRCHNTPIARMPANTIDITTLDGCDGSVE